VEKDTMNSPLSVLDFESTREQALQSTVHSIAYSEPEISTVGASCFRVKTGLFVPRANPKHPFYRQQHEPFDLEHYQYPRAPIDIGHSRLSFEALGPATPNVLRMPIKYPGTDFRLPPEISPFWELIERVAEYEAGFNERIDECFAHFTVDRTIVTREVTHRFLGFHADGVQGAKFSQKKYTPIEHSYIVASAPPTEFCLQPFFFGHLSDSRHNIFHEMEVQARRANIYGTIPWNVYLIDPFMVHRTPPIAQTVERIFIRVTFTYTELENPHNTRTPLFPEQVYPERHDIRKFLTLYQGEVPWEMYGFSFGPASTR
jgi:hypothetical protein